MTLWFIESFSYLFLLLMFDSFCWTGLLLYVCVPRSNLTEFVSFDRSGDTRSSCSFCHMRSQMCVLFWTCFAARIQKITR